MKILIAALLSTTALFALQPTTPKPAVNKKHTVPALPAPRSSGSCKSVNGLPDSSCTPGEVRTTSVTSICSGGSTTQYRPPTSYTDKLKVQQITEYGFTDTKPSDYEEDHLISLEIGGDGSDPKNLWPEPHKGKYNSFMKDQVENWLHRQICVTKTMTPQQAQDGIKTNWEQYIPDVLDSKSNKTVERP
jgi:hypothetical protein